jgi:hypothetical protein
MTIRPLRLFCKALDELPGLSAARFEWRLLLAGEWPAARRFLKSTGKLARQVDCPSPGGDECPRQIIRHANGRVRAVCGNRPAVCDTLDLSDADITILTVDTKKLATAVGSALGTSGTSAVRGNRLVFDCGSHGVAAGVGIPVAFIIPGPFGDCALFAIPESLPTEGPLILVAPRAQSIPARTRNALTANPRLLLDLEDLIGFDASHAITPFRAAKAVLADIDTELLGNANSERPWRAWVLPADAKWESLTLEFIARDRLQIDFRGEKRSFDSAGLRMQNAKTLKPNAQWTLLQGFAAKNGVMERPVGRKSIVKTKQLLSQALRDAFGINGDPIEWRAPSKTYRTRFVSRGDVIGAGAAGVRCR